MENKEQLKGKVIEAIDVLAKGIKEASKLIFDAVVNQASDCTSTIFDQYTEKTKEKVKGEDDNAPE